MIYHPKRQSGFTAVELLITLFVAATFLIAAYELFNLVIKDGGATRSESRATNIAYDYLRRYAASAPTIPCTASHPLSNSPLSVDGLVNVTIDVTVSCLPNASTSLSKVEVAVTYNVPAETIKYATYTSSSGSSGTADITNGLVAWWKLNGTTNNSVGAPNGVGTNVISTTGQSGKPSTAYSFNGTTSSINTSSTFGLGSTNATISCWVYNPSASNHGLFVHVGYTGFGIGMGSTTTNANGTKIVIIFDNVGWIPTTADLGTGWHYVVMTLDGNGIPAAYLDGTLIGSYPGTLSNTPTNAMTTIGGLNGSTTNSFSGSVDDVRLYNRVLSQAEITSLYSRGAQ